MHVSNEEMVQKAISAAESLANNGKLNPAQSQQFLDYVVDETVLKNNARIVRFTPETMEINKIGVGRRVAMPKSEGSDPNVRRGVTTSKIVLQPREIIVPWEVTDIFDEVNLEGMSVEDHIVKMMATAMANNIEEMFILADPTGPAVLQGDILENGDTARHIKDAFLSMTTGWSRLADGANIVDAAGVNIGFNLFSSAMRALPTKFRRNPADLRFFMSPNLYQRYLEKIASRGTPLGDAVAGGDVHRPWGVPVVQAPLWPEQPKVVEHVVLTGTTPVQLRHAPVSNVVVHPSTLGSTPTSPYVEDTDYSMVDSTGIITRIGGGISSGQTVKVTYDANPQMLLTHMKNLIVGIGRDIRIEKDRDIYKGANQYVITAKVDVQLEELSAVVKVKNIGMD